MLSKSSNSVTDVFTETGGILALNTAGIEMYGVHLRLFSFHEVGTVLSASLAKFEETH